MRKALLAGVAAAVLALGGIATAEAGPITITGDIVPPGTVPFTLLNLGASNTTGDLHVSSPIIVSYQPAECLTLGPIVGRLVSL